MTDEQFKMVGHSLGINTYNAELSKQKKYKHLPDEFYRNYYCAGVINGEFEILIGSGIARKWVRDDQIIYGITEKGVTLFRQLFHERVTLTYVKPSKSKQAYLDYLDAADCFDSFAHYLGIEQPTRNYDYNGKYSFSSEKTGVSGEWKSSIKEAKASYKEKLKEKKLKK